jgi:serine protease Do
MALSRAVSFRPLGFAVLLLALAGLGAAPPLPKDQPLPAALTRLAPEGVADLLTIEKQVQAVVKKVMPAVVGLRIGPAAGSGVIVSPDGTILTAGHVSGTPNRDVLVFLADGRRVRGKTLGNNRGIDSGMIKITEKGTWPAAPLGDSAKVKRGDWCIAVGHPGGYKPGRTPVVRVGRILVRNDNVIRSDCTLVGGDSGGPLFDMRGRVIGIHSRIGVSIDQNVHVPVNTYKETWDRLAAAETWGGMFSFFGGGGRGRRTRGGYLGVILDREADSCKVLEVNEGGPAEKAGLKPGDVITRLGNQPVPTSDDLRPLLADKRPGSEVVLVVQRGTESVKIKVVLGRWPR